MRKIGLALLCGIVASGLSVPMAAQTVPYSEPEAPCEVSFGHFLANGAHQYLRQAAEGKYADQVPKLERDAFTNLSNALKQDQQSNPAIWLLLGRYYGMKGDVAGMDSSYKKLQSLEPKCTKDIIKNRRTLWVGYVNNGVDAQKRNDNAAARADFIKANGILGTDPTTYYYLGNMSATETQKAVATADSFRRAETHADSLKADSIGKAIEVAQDSAIADYRIVIRLGGDSANRTVATLQEMRTTATFNVARLFHRRKQWDSAAAYYSKVRETHPNDAQALTGLATVYSASGKGVAAQALYDTVIVLADSLDPMDLFAAGVELFKVNAFERSAMALKVGLKRNPYYRDAWYNLDNAYLSLGNEISSDIDSVVSAANKARPAAPPPTRGGRGGRGAAPAAGRPDTSALPKLRRDLKGVGDSMLVTSRKLIDLDPHSKIPQRLLATAFRFLGNDDSTLAVVQRVHDMTYDVVVSQLDVTPSGALVQGQVITSPGAAPVAVPAIAFDFLDRDGKVVTSGSAAGQSQPANTARPFEVRVSGAKIAGWRYKTGS